MVCVHVWGFRTAGYRRPDKQTQGSDAEVPARSRQAATALNRVRRSWAGGSAQIFLGGPGGASYISWSSCNFMVQKSASGLVTVAADCPWLCWRRHLPRAQTPLVMVGDFRDACGLVVGDLGASLAVLPL